MFNFTTQSVYNNIIEATVTQKGDRVSKDANLILNTVSNVTPTLRIGNTRFVADDILDIHIKKPSKESLAKVTFNLQPLLDQANGENITARFVLYIGLSMNAQDAFYANDYGFKGKPLTVEFPVKASDADDNGAALVKRIAKIAKKHILLSMGTEEIIRLETTNPTAASGTEGDPGYVAGSAACISFVGVNGYQQIRKAVLQYFDPEAKTVDCCTKDGEYIDLVTGVPVAYVIGNEGVAEIDGTAQKLTEEGLQNLEPDEVAILPGLEAFGDYNWLIHNLRLPTAANYYPWSPANRMGEIPVPGQKYTQFIIRIKKERDGIMGEIVGARGVSVTTHVLYVAGDYEADANSPAYKVNDALTNASKLNVPADKVFTKADEVLAEPYDNA